MEKGKKRCKTEGMRECKSGRGTVRGQEKERDGGKERSQEKEEETT